MRRAVGSAPRRESMPRQPMCRSSNLLQGWSAEGPAHLFQHKGLERPRLQVFLHKVGAAGGRDLGLAVCRLGLIVAKSQVFDNVPAGKAHMQGLRRASSSFSDFRAS